MDHFLLISIPLRVVKLMLRVGGAKWSCVKHTAFGSSCEEIQHFPNHFEFTQLSRFGDYYGKNSKLHSSLAVELPSGHA